MTASDRDSVQRVILGSSVALGHSLGLAVVGEGVETEAEWDLLLDLGCDQAQGYLIARPMPVAEFLGWKATWDRTALTSADYQA